MTTATQADPTMEAINAAIAQGRAGRTDEARGALLQLWTQIGVLGDPLHRCWLAHSLADLHEEPAEALTWDVRAIDAAQAMTQQGVREAAGLSIAGFYPSLHLNLADNYRRLRSFTAAADHLNRAREHAVDLPEDAYGAMILPLLDRALDLIAAHDTRPLAEAAQPPR